MNRSLYFEAELHGFRYSLINKESHAFLREDFKDFELSEYLINYQGNELGFGLEILRKALALDQTKRYISARDMQEDLMIWQKMEYSSPSVLKLAMAKNRENYYKSLFQKSGGTYCENSKTNSEDTLRI